MKLLTRELIENLDLIVASQIHPLERQDIEAIKLVDFYNKVVETLKSEELREVQFFAADLGYYFAPYLSRGSPVKNDKVIYGNRASGRVADSLVALYGNPFENS